MVSILKRLFKKEQSHVELDSWIDKTESFEQMDEIDTNHCPHVVKWFVYTDRLGFEMVMYSKFFTNDKDALKFKNQLVKAKEVYKFYCKIELEKVDNEVE